ncbi:helix-turn-helix domain-containing protein [Pseudomonas mosselii]|uniref:helix-turn-helix domain-containing protein n=1 Tax=Pseudomonas mosselii TaxID=78327 RepID=UPI0024DF27FD|nr:helix-turn-helix transcriptional regulator [Pseudomonas mosselii]
MILHDSKDIGARLRDERMRCGMTQDQAAAGCGIAKRTLANYEAGASDPSASYLSKAWALGFDVPYVLTGVRATVARESLSSEEDLLIEQYRRIPEQDQRALRRFLKAMFDDASQ